jgi:hypothetical protein
MITKLMPKSAGVGAAQALNSSARSNAALAFCIAVMVAGVYAGTLSGQ